MLKNPFLVYLWSFGAVLACYQLGWSEIYPPLSFDLLIFFGLTFYVSILLALAVSNPVSEIAADLPGQLPKYLILVLLVCFAADIIYTGGFPLIMVMDGQFDYASTELGVPHLHVFTATAASAFSTIRFSDYLHTKRLRYLAEAVAPLIYFVLIFYRGPALICLVSWGFVYFFQGGRIGLMRISAVAILTLLVLHLFGLFGDLREGEGAIESIGKPTEAFEASAIPKTYFWTYIYLTSPIANLQLAVDTTTPEAGNAAVFVVSEMLPDFVSKRILPLMDAEQVKPPQAAAGLTAASLYGRAYVYEGWVGATLMFTCLSALIIVYLRLIRHSPYRVSCLALLNTLVFFCTFHNMIAYAGLILQLVWPLFFAAWPFYRKNKRNPVLDDRQPMVGTSAP
jgi:hypothetical protein